MRERPITTLFMLMSLDGKISTGASDLLDVDKDFPCIDGVKEGLKQYYEIEQTTDLWSLNSGRVQSKIGVNEAVFPKERGNVSFVVLDNTHLSEQGVEYFSRLSKEFVLVTSNKNHPAYNVAGGNIHILYYERLDLKIMLEDLYGLYGCQKLTIQTGGTLNSLFLREKLFDYVDIIVAPALIGGSKTSTLIDGTSLMKEQDLENIGVLELLSVKKLENSYIRLSYKVIN